MDADLRAGFSRTALAPPQGIPMMGYGARQGVAEGQIDELFARALYLEGARSLLLVECDLCLISVSQADAIRDRIVHGTPLSPEQVVVACTHTHSGPDTGLAALLAGREEPPHFAGMRDRIVSCARKAISDARPASLGVGSTVLGLGRNRRRADAAVDEQAWVLRIDREGDVPSLILFGYGCHATVLGHDNLRYSADWPGAAIREVERGLPGTRAMFVLGAHGDIDPRTRGLLDLAQANQSVGVRPEEMEALGTEAGRAIADCGRRIRSSPGAAVDIAATRVSLRAHGAGPERHAGLDARRRSAFEALGIPPDSRPRTSELYRLEQERTVGLPAEERRHRIAKLRLYLRDRSARVFAGGESPEVEVQVLRIGPLALAAFPLECCTDVGLAWRDVAPSEFAGVVSIANGWLRYLPHRANFEEPGAETRYEVLQSTLAPEASERLIDAAQRLVREGLARGGPGSG